MKITVEMTDEEFTEFLKYRADKKTDQRVINGLRREMENISSAILEAVQYDGEPRATYEIYEDSELTKAVVLASEWYD